ncbi:hypothetical protein CC1G_08939 [Coprinopsis cinerea okayama7|uniref:Uncharacterized protein n=1 Tax=Coprinopsis cinerea (strain Okayama-7 / 130 / ATCC MYA-4618 / FGSC 9003) TaxID=240176 RepID=A8P4N1_COPC7|nr:hypothetical protein CC1G_08939 [Coprinopsis cinerea okayama7\|eukprot:XP_001838775.1 hypothetical protein CC1G_08939 [Coprinopsis cinerea okayama7\
MTTPTNAPKKSWRDIILDWLANWVDSFDIPDGRVGRPAQSSAFATNNRKLFPSLLEPYHEFEEEWRKLGTLIDKHNAEIDARLAQRVAGKDATSAVGAPKATHY